MKAFVFVVASDTVVRIRAPLHKSSEPFPRPPDVDVHHRCCCSEGRPLLPQPPLFSLPLVWMDVCMYGRRNAKGFSTELLLLLLLLPSHSLTPDTTRHDTTPLLCSGRPGLKRPVQSVGG